MKIKYYLVLGLILTLLFSFTSCVYYSLEPSPTIVPTVTPSPIDPNYSPPPTTDSRPLPAIPNFVDAIASVRASVVAINTTAPGLDLFGGTLNVKGAGSGWIIDNSGLIVTNSHVIEGATGLTVTLEDGRNFTADLVRADPISDLAVIKINAPNLKAAKVGDSTKLRVGDWVAAIGNSLGQGISATKGIVSALDVTVAIGAGESLYNLIQTDAAINPGNSGGPLINLLGEIVGITNIKVAQLGIEGMGYAISTKEALPVVSDLVKVGYVIRPWIGVSLYTVDQIVVLRYDLAVSQGTLVTQLAVGSPADKAGIRTGDVITGVDGQAIANIDDFNKIVHGDQIGQQVNITYYRGTSKNTVSVTLIASPPPFSAK